MQSKILNNTALIDLGATNTRFALATNEGKLFCEFRAKTEKTEKKLIQSLIRGLVRLKAQGDFSRIGLSVAGPVKGDKTYLTNVTGNFLDIKNPIADYFKVPVSLINDCSAAVLAEKEYGYGKNLESIIYLTISSGIGGGVVRNNHLVWFPNVKQELGHLKINSDYSLICKCGGMGHWQAFSSGFSLPYFFKVWNKKRGKKNVPLKYGDVFKLFKQCSKGDKTAIDFFEEVGKLNAKAMDMIVVKYKPQLIVLGGSVALFNKETIYSGISRHMKEKVPIKFTELGDEICLRGAFVYANKLEKTQILK